MPPPVSSQPSTTVPVSIPIFTKSTISHHTSATPISSVNELKYLHEKINQLLLESKASTSEAYSKTTVESILERVTKEHSTNVSSLSKVVSDSTDVCKPTTEKVDKISANTMEFMEDYKTTYNSNTVAANKAIQNVGLLFQTEKSNFVELHKALKSDHEAFQSSITEKITKLQADLVTESKIMDALSIKEEKYKVLETKLQYTHKQVDDLIAEKAVTCSCISDVTELLSDIIETHDLMTSITLKKHLADKLRPMFAMLHHLEGVSQPMFFFSKQGGEGSSKDQTNVPPAPVKLPVIKQEPNKKENIFNEEPIVDDSEDEEPDEADLKRWKAHEAEINDHARIVKEA
ncbi:unnamed protein product [Lactuca saligna]|uniref:Uncharacterized protein n=1 Tax=Lactuca saligna TaxID=75948 RepID=A0AA35YQK1_LACSI|nr:unnamed protein product [Lactuca saligna]